MALTTAQMFLFSLYSTAYGMGMGKMRFQSRGADSSRKNPSLEISEAKEFLAAIRQEETTELSRPTFCLQSSVTKKAWPYPTF